MEAGKPGEKPLEAWPEPTNLAHIWHQVGIEPEPHWWEVNALTTAAPGLLTIMTMPAGYGPQQPHHGMTLKSEQAKRHASMETTN